MRKYVMAITYEPKIEPVKDGRCKQTIRIGRKVAVGDEILFHGWEGRPYHSKWSWRLRVVVKKVVDILVEKDGTSSTNAGMLWTGTAADQLAKADYIKPPTGIKLRDVLFKFGGIPTKPEEYQVVLW